MKASVFLSIRYLRAHKAQFFSAVFVCAMFLASYVATTMVRESFIQEANKLHEETFGVFPGISYNISEESLSENMPSIIETQSGLVKAYGTVLQDGKLMNAHIGSMDDYSISLRRLTVIEGRFPVSVDECAIEYSTLVALFPSASCGDNIYITYVIDGKTEIKQFVLVGVINDYLSNWQGADASKESVKYPPPTVLLGEENNSLTVEYTHVICSDNILSTTLDGVYSINGHGYSDPMLTSKIEQINQWSLIIVVFCMIVSAFGVAGSASNIAQGYIQNMRLLRYIGISDNKCVFIFLIYGMLVYLLSSIIGIALGIMIGSGSIYIIDKVYSDISASFSGVSMIPALFINAVIIFSLFLSSTRRVLLGIKTKADRTIKTKAIRRNTGNSFALLWLYSHIQKRIPQTIVSVLLIAGCLFISVFGGFICLIIPWESYGDVESQEIDYRLYISGGVQTPEEFYITLPRPMGVSQEDVDLLNSTPGVQVDAAYVRYMTSHFILYDDLQQSNQYCDMLISQDRALDLKNIPWLNELITQLGGSTNSVLVEPYLIGISYENLATSIEILEGNVDKQSYMKGEELIAPDTFNVGDKVLLVTPIISNPDVPASNPERFDFIVNEVIVSALYDSDYGNAIYYSAEAITSTDSSARYEQVDISILNDSYLEAIKRTLIEINARSPYTTMKDYISQRLAYEEMVKNGQALIAILVLVFLSLVTLSIAMYEKSKIRSGKKSYLLLRAIGANKKQMYKCIIIDVAFVIVLGAIVGIVGAVCVSTSVFKSAYSQLSVFNFLLTPVIFSIIVSSVMMLISALSILPTIQDIFEAEIGTSICDVEP